MTGTAYYFSLRLGDEFNDRPLPFSTIQRLPVNGGDVYYFPSMSLSYALYFSTR